MKPLEDSSEQHDSVLQTKTGPQVHQIEPSVSLAGRQVIAGRYAILGALGRGGMGEVWHAFDLKLRVDVALKSLRTDRMQHDVEALRREVRTAREVISPNVCRIFDLVVEGEQELVSMEYIDGITLAELVQKHGPLELQQAADIASQFLSGLQAIHQAGLVHRDFKPENVMITRTGRVVVMDFGIARYVAQPSETISGTPSYMAPEQLQGKKLDPRSDIFAAGVVLAEMIQPDGVRTKQSREALLAAIRQEPLQLPDHPWKKIINQAVHKNPEQRFPSPALMARALEEILQRAELDESRRPYPGLSAFTENDAEFFFGRELEVEAVIKKLHELHLMGIIGPSGAGKTSFLRAGLIPALPEEWSYLVCQPGDVPFRNLAHALVTEFTGDAEAIHQMLRFEEADIALSLLGRWRKAHSEAVLIVDRFEELFTLNSTETQSQISGLLARAAVETDLRVVLAMRDDFLLLCHRYSSLAPIFNDLTPMLPLGGDDLRRAIVQPAHKCGYRFEDDALVEEIIADVEKERGALPLMAFAASRLWEKRDRQSGILTRKAYDEIGGVAGALAQHAETTMERIGADKYDIVREIFRNLITAQGTRAARDTEELLSVFRNRKDAEEVLRAMINARLLTSFEMKDEAKSRVEIIHESLLSAWPRLVRWQTQNADSAQLHDQLRQAAHLWQDRGRPPELLWTGASYKEFELWRERYAGGLTATEESFAQAMKNRATKHRRQRTTLVFTIFVVLLALLGVVGNFWRGEKSARQQAEASKVLALGRNELEKDPTVALGYAIASLEIADNEPARRFAVEALSKAPPVSVEPNLPIRPTNLEFSPDGNWLAIGGFGGVRLMRRDGKESRVLEEGFSQIFRTRRPKFSPNGDLVVWMSAHEPFVRVWSMKKNKEIRRFKMEGRTFNFVRGGRLILITDISALLETGLWKETLLRSWDFKESEPEIIGRLDFRDLNQFDQFDIDPTGRWMAYSTGESINLRSLENLSAPPRLLGKHTAQSSIVTFHPDGQEIASSDVNGEIRLWSIASSSKIPIRIIPAKGPVYNIHFSHSGSNLVVSHKDGKIHLWDTNVPEQTEPMLLQRSGLPAFPFVAFDPADEWVAVAYSDSIVFWPLNHQMPGMLRGDGEEGSSGMDFAPDGKLLAAGFTQGSIHLWPWPIGQPSRFLWQPPVGELYRLKIDPSGQFLGIGTSHGGACLISIADGKARQLPHEIPGRSLLPFSFSPDGKFAASANAYKRDDSGIRIWNLQSDEVSLLKGSRGLNFWSLEFASDGTLFSGDDQGNLRKWDLKTGDSTLVESSPHKGMVLGAISFAATNPRLMVSGWWDPLADMQEWRSEIKLIDLNARTSRTVVSHGNRVSAVKIDPSGKLLITGDADGILRVGPITGGEPHLLYKHDSQISMLAVHPDSQWIVSSEVGQPIVRIWQMPKGQPLQSLKYDELLTRLRGLTNIRVIADPSASTGYKVKFETFRGWEKPPVW